MTHPGGEFNPPRLNPAPPDPMHTEPRHPTTLAIYYPAHLSPGDALAAIHSGPDGGRVAGRPTSHASGPAWLFHGVTLTPEETRAAALARGQSRIAAALATGDHDTADALFRIVSRAVLDPTPAALEPLLAVL